MSVFGVSVLAPGKHYASTDTSDTFSHGLGRKSTVSRPALRDRKFADSPVEEGVSCELVSGNPDFNVRKKRTGVQKPSLISILIRFNDY